VLPEHGDAADNETMLATVKNLASGQLDRQDRLPPLPFSRITNPASTNPPSPNNPMTGISPRAVPLPADLCGEQDAGHPGGRARRAPPQFRSTKHARCPFGHAQYPVVTISRAMPSGRLI